MSARASRGGRQPGRARHRKWADAGAACRWGAGPGGRGRHPHPKRGDGKGAARTLSRASSDARAAVGGGYGNPGWGGRGAGRAGPDRARTGGRPTCASTGGGEAGWEGARGRRARGRGEGAGLTLFASAVSGAASLLPRSPHLPHSPKRERARFFSLSPPSGERGKNELPLPQPAGRPLPGRLPGHARRHPAVPRRQPGGAGE